ncbi:MAG: tetratricopeptide repeat protein [Tunicatimonas sp.]
MKTLVSSIAFIALFALPTFAQVSADVQQLFYRGYLTVSKAPWEQAIQKIEQDASLDETQKLTAITEAQTGLLVYALANQDEATYNAVADDLEDNLETLLEQDKTDARSLAKMARLNGATMAFNSWKATYLGPKNEKLVDRALKADPESPEAWMQRGGSLLFTPAMFGGDVDESVTAFEKAVRYYEAQPDHTRNWQYLDALAWLGQAYQKAERPAEAAETFTKALEVEPDFGWVKYKLLPTAQASTK